MRVVICWSNISGYMAACWRALAATGLEIHVIAFSSESSAPFDPTLMLGISHRLLSVVERSDAALVVNLVASFEPDAVVLCGWFLPAYVQLANSPRLSKKKMYLTMDTPWRGELKQFLARYRLRNYTSRMTAVFVPGERGFQYAKHLGFAEEQIHRGVYGMDHSHFASATALRSQLNAESGWPSRFLFVGRYEHVKAIDILLSAYANYRSQVRSPWPLTCCGTGPLAASIRDAEGVEDVGFVQPSSQPELFARHGAFIMPSRYEPWGVAIAEAAAAGLPICCTEACNAGIDLVRPYFNGIKAATNSVPSLAKCLVWMHDNQHLLPEFGRRSIALAAAYDTAVWALHWQQTLLSD